MEYDAVNYIIEFFDNADISANGMLRCLRKTMDNMKLDWERISCFTADNANCNSKNKKLRIYIAPNTPNDTQRHFTTLKF